MYRAAMSSIVSELARSERLIVVENFDVSEPKTKLLVKQLADMGLSNVMIVTEEVDKNLYLASRNLHKVSVSDVAGVNPVSLVGSEKVLVTVSALKKIEEMLA
jgi:large subunit ribosomal protein L4